MILDGKNLYIVKKKPKAAGKVESKGAVLYLLDDKDEILEKGIIDLKKDVHTCLFCKQLKNITFIIKGENIFSSSLILTEEAQFEIVLKMIKEACPTVQLSEQDTKIYGYAASLVEKLQEGVQVTVMENKKEKVKCCPVCGMECDPNIPYCMECGASV